MALLSRLTAAHAALGAPMRYDVILTNTGKSTTKVSANVTLVAPDGTSDTLRTTQASLTAGQIKSLSGTFTTSA